MSEKIKKKMKSISVVFIFISALVSLMLRKDLGHTQANLGESTQIQEDIEDEVERESVETIAENTKVEGEEVIELEVETDIQGDRTLVDKEGIILVNRNNPLPKDYEVELKWLANGREQVASEMYDDLQAMFSKGKSQGLQFVVASGYRSVSRQQEIWDNTIRKWKRKGLSEEEAAEETSKTLAYPGESEHATGLAVDIVSIGYQNLDDKQHDTKESIWLRENCHQYGFILRYPKGKEEITGITYESWHFRYVGKEVAEYIMDRNITLEEYLELGA